MFLANPHARREPYPPALQQVMNIAQARAARRSLAHWDLLAPAPTPVWPLAHLARDLGIGAIGIKDESARSVLGSFKVLGAPVALLRLVQRQRPEWSDADLFGGRHAAALADLVVISATDGNHGRALAAAARSLGCRCVIVLHAQVSAEREQAIAALGARIVRIAGNYDDSVHEAARLARANGWQVVSDTSYDGYEEIPRDVMQGYAVLADELLDHVDPAAPCPYTHVFLQGGVGGLAAGVASYFWERFGAARPVLVVVEPQQADCLMQSCRSGAPAPAPPPRGAGVAPPPRGAAAPQARPVQQRSIDCFQTVGDDEATHAMRVLAQGGAGDVPVVAGESGAAGLAGLLALAGDPVLRREAGLDDAARVLLFNTEGATAPALYESLAGASASQVLQAQREWLRRQGA